jgi:hypothetical protein
MAAALCRGRFHLLIFTGSITMTRRDELLAELRQLFEQRGELELKLAKAEAKRATASFDCKSLASLVGKLAPKMRDVEQEIITGLTGLPIFDAAAKRLAERAEETKAAPSETIAAKRETRANGVMEIGPKGQDLVLMNDEGVPISMCSLHLPSKEIEEEPKPKKGRGKKAEAKRERDLEKHGLPPETATFVEKPPLGWSLAGLVLAARMLDVPHVGELDVCLECQTVQDDFKHAICPTCGAHNFEEGQLLIDRIKAEETRVPKKGIGKKAEAEPSLAQLTVRPEDLDWTGPELFEDQWTPPGVPEPKRGRGRPPGARNKPKEATASAPA